MKSSSWKHLMIPGWFWVCLAVSTHGKEITDDQPIARAIPMDDLQPKFDPNIVSFSRSKQFRISGSDPATRGAAVILAEEIKDGLLHMLEEKDEWKVPVQVVLRGKSGDPIPLRTTVINHQYDEVGYQVKIFVNLSKGLEKESYQRAVIAAYVLARSLQDATKDDAHIPHKVAPWIIEGIAEAAAWRLGQSDRRLYDALFRHGGLYQIEDLFELDEAGYISLDAASRAAFRVSAGALIMALIEQPDGKAGMKVFLNEAPSFSGEMSVLLRRLFPELNLSQTSLSKWWALQLATKGNAPLVEVLDVVTTDKELERALKIRYRGTDGLLIDVSWSDWEKVPELTKPEKLEAVRITEEQLVRLSYRCFPSYRDLLKEYQIVMSKWTVGDTKSISTTLSTLAERRIIMVEKSIRARDYLDWFEITRARETSGAFDDYLALNSRLKLQSVKRKDSISKYLDLLDPLFVLPEQPKPKIFLPNGH